MKKLTFLAFAIMVISACTRESSINEEKTPDLTLYPLSFVSSNVATRADASNSNLEQGSHISLSVFPTVAPGNGNVAKFIDSRYLVADLQGKIGLTYNNNIVAADPKQKIIEVSPGEYNIYGVGVNDGYTGVVWTTANPELNSTYATINGYEYVHAAVKQTVTSESSSRQVKLSFERQVAKVSFSVVGSASVTLPSTPTADQVVKSPKMRLPIRNASIPAEGVMHLNTGITEPLTGGIGTSLESVVSNPVGASLGLYAYVLPLNVSTNALTYDVQFKLLVDDGGGTPKERVFDVKNIPLPTMDGGDRGFAKGKHYSYTVTLSNTGVYISEVQVKNWEDKPQPPLDAQ